MIPLRGRNTPNRQAPALLRMVLLLALLCAALPVLATERPPVDVRIMDTGAGVLPGERFEGTLLISAPMDLTLARLRLDAGNTQVDWLAGPAGGESAKSGAGVRMPRGDELRFPFVLTAGASVEPLTIEYEVNGLPVTRRFDISQKTYLAGLHGYATEAVPGLQPGPVGDPGRLRPAPPPKAFSRRLDGVAPAADLDAPVGGPGKSYNLRVYGRFIYYRPDTPAEIGAQSATVRVYDEDTFSDQLLYTTVTDENGDFDVTFNYSDSEAPDIYVQFEAANSRVEVEEASILQNNYRWNTSTWDNYGGTVLNIGTHQPSNEGQRPALHILTQISRSWTYIDTQGWDTPTVDAQWPDGSSGAWYDGAIHISSGEQWYEPSIVHEWGHHWINSFASGRSPDYCNGYCDEGSCGHCLWCPENNAIAFSEGWPDWLSTHLTHYFATRYTPAPSWHYNFESLSDCGYSGGFLADPWSTEGTFAAFLLDLEDSAQDDHPEYPGVSDVLDFAFSIVLGFTDSFQPETTPLFFDDLMAFYPDSREDIWETAANCGYQLDDASPGAPIGLTSPSHAVSYPSPDNTVDLSWTPPDDDASGAGGYSLLVTTTGAALPDQTTEIGRVTSYTHSALAAGTYYFNLRAQDRSGKWSNTYATYGPVIIRNSSPTNLLFWASFSWPRSLIPRPHPDVIFGGAGGPYIDDPVTLDPAGTYLNMFALNSGDQGTGVGPSAIYYVDEEYVYEANWAPIGPLGEMVTVNMGPFATTAGRHVLHAWLDAYEWIAETDETDNFEGHQWVWTPQTLTASVPVTLDRPSNRFAGWEYVNDGQTLYVNCDGFRYAPTGYWQAVVLHPLDTAADLDLSLYAPSSGADNGFTTPQASSARLAGQLDATLVNGNNVAWDTRDVGVSNYNDSDGSYILNYVNSSTIAQDTPTTVSLAADRMLFVREFNATESGLYTVHVETSDPGDPMQVHWFASDFLMGGIDDAQAFAQTDSTGSLDLELNVSLTGWNGLAVFREPAAVSDPVDVVLEVGVTRPELYPVDVAGWYAPLVPRAAADAMPGATPTPGVLTGNTATTYFNTAIINDGSMVSVFDSGIYLDNDQTRIDSQYYVDQPPQTAALVNNKPSTDPIPGGRHTLVLWVDPTDQILEQTEMNNLYGEQWIWSPFQLSDGAVTTRPEPYNRLGGMDGVTAGETYYFDCDGLRTPVFVPGQPHTQDNNWSAVAIMPPDGNDLDIRFHQLSSGPKDGFADPLAISGWGPGQSDFVIVNVDLTGPVQLDAGVVNVGYPTGNYTVQTVSSSFRAAQPQGALGPFTLAAGEILDLHQFTLDLAEYDITLQNLSGTVDWGLTLHRQDLEYLGKSDDLPGGTAWLAGAGQDESITVSVPTAGDYLLSVWKARSDDLAKDGSYQLLFASHVSGLPDQADLPSVSRLAGAVPNPFNPSTTISFALARAGVVRLRIYNLRGKLVRTLLNASRPAGRHAVSWNGRDDSGETVSSGVYLLKMTADDVEDLTKITLLK